MAKTELLTMDNYIKFSGFIAGICSLYFAIKSDIRELATEKRYEIEHLQYQVTELKDCCNNKHNEKRLVFNERVAIMPNDIKIEE
jgi:hypothetical protein